MDSFQKFSTGVNLKDECISEKDYLYAINVWNTFKINKYNG